MATIHIYKYIHSIITLPVVPAAVEVWELPPPPRALRTSSIKLGPRSKAGLSPTSSSLISWYSWAPDWGSMGKLRTEAFWLAIFVKPGVAGAEFPSFSLAVSDQLWSISVTIHFSGIRVSNHRCFSFLFFLVLYIMV